MNFVHHSPSEECALCLEARPIVSSHLVPSGFYKLMRDNRQQNPNPILIGESRTTQTSSQIEAPLLCAVCEERFNRQGERWVLQNCFRDKGDFKIQTELLAAAPLHRLEQVTVYPGSRMPGVDVEALVYFGISVFWRAGAREWRLHDHSKRLDLGPYQEDLRLYLMTQGPFPKHAALWINVSPAPEPQLVGVFPHGGRRDEYHQFTFAVPGLAYHLFLGKRMPAVTRVMCSATSPERFIYVSTNLDDFVIHSLASSISRTSPTGSLRKRGFR